MPRGTSRRCSHASVCLMPCMPWLVVCRLVYQSTRLSWLIWITPFFRKIDWIDSVHFPSELIGDWVNSFSYSRWLSRLTLRDCYDWINWIDSKYLKKGQRNRTFPKKNQRNRTFSRKGQQNRRFSKKVKIDIELIDLMNHFNHSFDLIESIRIYVLSNMNELVGIFKLYRFMVTEPVYFHIWKGFTQHRPCH